MKTKNLIVYSFLILGIIPETNAMNFDYLEPCMTSQNQLRTAIKQLKDTGNTQKAEELEQKWFNPNAINYRWMGLDGCCYIEYLAEYKQDLTQIYNSIFSSRFEHSTSSVASTSAASTSAIPTTSSIPTPPPLPTGIVPPPPPPPPSTSNLINTKKHNQNTKKSIDQNNQSNQEQNNAAMMEEIKNFRFKKHIPETTREVEQTNEHSDAQQSIINELRRFDFSQLRNSAEPHPSQLSTGHQLTASEIFINDLNRGKRLLRKVSTLSPIEEESDTSLSIKSRTDSAVQDLSLNAPSQNSNSSFFVQG